jgi:hypothetical protein
MRKDSTTIDWVRFYLLYLFVATFHILLYHELTGKGILTSHLTDDIHSKDQKSPHQSENNEFDNGAT